jgi:hypothetical protein
MTTPAPTIFSLADYAELHHLLSGGDITKSTKVELERFAVMLSRPDAHVKFGWSSFPQVCETVRTLLIVRMSEEANTEATRISKIALWIAIAALICSLIQAAASLWPLVKA